MACDLHIHSKASDGTLTPEEVVEEAHRLGLKYISITDHDSVSGIEPALVKSKSFDFPTVIPGVELSAESPESDLHILGYFIDYTDKKLLEKLAHNLEARFERGRKMVEKLNSIGIGISFSSVLEFSGRGAVGRSHIAKALIKDGFVSSAVEAFKKYLGKDSPFYVEKYSFNPEEVITVIRGAGGIPFLAHPGTVKGNLDYARLKVVGLEGIEVFHGNHSVSDTIRFKRVADKFGLLISGGSDSHGPHGLFERQMGAVKVSDRYAESIIEFHERESDLL